MRFTRFTFRLTTLKASLSIFRKNRWRKHVLRHHIYVDVHHLILAFPADIGRSSFACLLDSPALCTPTRRHNMATVIYYPYFLLGRVLITCRFSSGFAPIPFRFRSDLAPESLLTRFCSVPVPFQFRSGSVPVLFWSRYDIAPIPIRFRALWRTPRLGPSGLYNVHLNFTSVI